MYNLLLYINKKRKKRRLKQKSKTKICICTSVKGMNGVFI